MSNFVATFVTLRYTNMKDRLRQFLAAENISQAQFADTINVVRASVSHILAGRNNPSFDFIKALMLNYPRLNVEWLMFGKGKMYKDSPAVEAVHPLEQTAASSAQPIVTPSAPQDLLFPEFDEVPAPETPEIKETVQQSENKPLSIDINTLISTTQNIKNQRKVAKIIILFDDGSYQEM